MESESYIVTDYKAQAIHSFCLPIFWKLANWFSAQPMFEREMPSCFDWSTISAIASKQSSNTVPHDLRRVNANSSRLNSSPGDRPCHVLPKTLGKWLQKPSKALSKFPAFVQIMRFCTLYIYRYCFSHQVEFWIGSRRISVRLMTSFHSLSSISCLWVSWFVCLHMRMA